MYQKAQLIVQKHVVVAEAPLNRYLGWPANNGLWRFADGEILVGFTEGHYDEFAPKENNMHNASGPFQSRFARSKDGAQTWMVTAAPFCNDTTSAIPRTTPVDFTHPDLVLRFGGAGYHGATDALGVFYVSMDRGVTFEGPFRVYGLLNDENGPLYKAELTLRTDYIVFQGRLFVFASARWVHYQDRVFVAELVNKTTVVELHFVRWIVGPDDPFRAVMPSTIVTSSIFQCLY
jgi:hypothetical protein